MLPSVIPNSTTHVKGLGDLVQAHIPSFFAAGTSRQLFCGFTPMLVRVFATIMLSL